MSSLPKRCYSLEEYFALELASDEKYEYWDGEIYCMSGASPAHEMIISNLINRLRTALRGRGCVVFPSNLRVKVPAYPPYRYPDLTALCGRAEYERIGGGEALINPSLIVEVLSPSTEAFDRGDKFSYYKSIPSFGEYLLIAQHRPHVTHYTRQADGSWSYEEINDLAAKISLTSLDCSLTLGELYEDVDFATAERSLPKREFDESR